MDWYEDEARFVKPSFDAKSFVHETFADNTVEEAEDVRKDLAVKKEETAAELVTLVKQNYFKFLDIAQESKELERELSGLRSLFVELRGSLETMSGLSFGFESRRLASKPEMASASKDDKDAESWRQRVQYIAEAELELDVMLSERRLEAAVALLEQAQGPLEIMRRRIAAEQNDSPDDVETLSRIEHRIAQVADALTMQLTSPAISAGEARSVFGLLKRMHLESKAKEVFLEGRSQHILAGMKQLKPDADRVNFIRSLTREVFFALRDSCTDYIQCFGESPSSMGFLSVWCLKEIRAFGNLWIRIVISRGEFESVVTPCLVEALSCVRVLEQFGFFMEKLLRNQLLNSVVEKYEKIVQRNVEQKMQERLAVEDWYASPQTSSSGNLNILKANSKEKTWVLTPSAVYCINSVYSFVSEAVNFLPPDLVPSISRIAFSLLQSYFTALSNRLDSPLNDQQLLGVMGNAVTIVSALGKELDVTLKAKNCPAMFESQLGQLFSHQCLKLCKKKSHFLLYRSWQFSAAQYAQIKSLPVSSSRQALKLFDWLTGFHQRLVQQISTVAENAEDISTSLMRQLLADIVDLIRDAEKEFWSQADSLSRESIIQFCLDLRWMQEASSACNLASPKLLRDIESCVQRAVLSYCTSSGEKNPKAVLPDASYFSEILSQQRKALKVPQ